MALVRQGTHPAHKRRPIAAPVHHPTPDLEMPCHHLPNRGFGGELAYELISSELLLDGQARLNLATFVTTWMPSIAARLMAETADKNMIDKDEYPQTAVIEERCVNILADLWNSPEAEEATGCSTTGSSEAAMLCGPRAQVALARAAAGRRQADRPTQPRHRHERAGLLGEVLPLLGRRAEARADGGRALSPDRR